MADGDIGLGRSEVVIQATSKTTELNQKTESNTVHPRLTDSESEQNLTRMAPPISSMEPTSSKFLSATNAPTKRTADDFIFGKMLGEGSFSTVYLAKDVKSLREYAIKVCDKTHIVRENKIPYVKREKEALNLLANTCPYFVKLYCTFQDARQLYFVLTYAPYGELLHLIKKLGSLDVNLTRFYTCELVLALEALKANGIIHRDLKPENILLDESMNILITDFGSAKITPHPSRASSIVTVDAEEAHHARAKRKNSFVGTANYVSPDLLTDKPATHACDLWALGCIVYQMLTGNHCFTGGSDFLIFKKILKLDYTFPENFPTVARDFVEKLLAVNADERLGATDIGTYTSIRSHPFFGTVDWDNLGMPPTVTSCLFDNDEGDCFERAEPGLGARQMARLIGLRDDGPAQTIYVDDAYGGNVEEEATLTQGIDNQNRPRKNIADISANEIESRLEIQKRSNKYHDLVEGNLILKQGLIDKRKGLIPRRRMFLLTLGPRLFYVEPTTMVLKGEVPWTDELKVDARNFKSFYIHTPNRTYNLEEPDGFALKWQQAIQDVHQFYFNSC